MPIKVALADDNLLVREGIVALLQRAPNLEIVAAVEDGERLLEAIDEQAPDVVLTDIRMPPSQGMEGVEIANELRSSHPDTGVIVLSQFAEPEYALALLERGASRRGYLLKDRLGSREQLVAAIEQVAAGGSAIDPQVVERLVERRSRGESSPLNRLTPREHQVLAEVATGKSNAAIGRSLVITKRAVERHISAIFSKLNLQDEADASRRVTATLLFLAERSTLEA